MRRGAELGAALLLMASAVWAAQADGQGNIKERWQKLVSEAQVAEAKGDRVRAATLRAEAYSVQAEIYWLEGDRTRSEASFAEGRKRGWKGAPPWTTLASNQQEEEHVELNQDMPEPIDRLTRETIRKLTEDEVEWQGAPYHHSRAATWNSLLGTPPFEEALVAPKSTWRALSWVEMTSSDFSAISSGGTTLWNATLLRENVEVDYTIFDKTMLGLRVRTGELYSTDGQTLRVFENGTQIVPKALGGFDVDSIILRAKYATRTKIGESGLLMELKVPLAAQEDLLTSGTYDLGIVGLFTKAVDQFAFHGNVGMVIPIGTPGIFSRYDEVNTYYTGAVGMGWAAKTWLNLGAQIEGNTSPFKDIRVLNASVITFTGRARINVGSLDISLALGHGLNASSGEWLYSAGAEVGF